jgi:hypothetical protein
MIKQINTFTGGYVPDIDPKRLRPDQMSDAQDLEFMSDDPGSSSSVEPMKSMALGYSIPDVAPKPTIVRLNHNTDPTTFTLKLAGSTLFTITSNSGIATIITNLNAAGAPNNIGFLSLGTDGDWAKVRIQGVSPVFYNTEFELYQDGQLCAILQIGNDQNRTMTQYQSLYLDDHLFIWSGDGVFSEFGVVVDSSGAMNYTRLLQSVYLDFPSNIVIDPRGEAIADNKWGIYFTHENVPRVFYVNKTIAQDSMLKYTVDSYNAGTAGYIFLGEENKQTALQLFAPELRVSYSDQLQTGGTLPSGGYFYSVRVGVKGTENTTPWSFLNANAIPVYVSSFRNSSSYADIQGDRSGALTGKINLLNVEGIDANLFDFIELACIYDADGVKSAYIVGDFKITGRSMIVKHIGTEQTKTLDVNDLPEYTNVILSAGSLEIKRNRLNLLNVENAFDENLVDTFAGVTLSSSKEILEPVGKAELIGETRASVYSLARTYSISGSGQLLILDFPGVASNPFGEWNTTNRAVWINSFSVPDTYFRFSGKIVPASAGGLVISIFKNGVLQSVVFRGKVSVGDGIEFSYGNASTSGDVWFIGAFFSSNDLSNLDFSVQFADLLIERANEGTLVGSVPGEYMLPENCANKVGHMLNESYMYGARVHYTNGYISSPYLLGSGAFTFGINTTDTNIFTNNNISDLDVYAYALNVAGLSALNGRDDILGVSIWRALYTPTVLATGVTLPADSANSSYEVGYYASIPISSGQYGTDVVALNNKRKFGMFISPDVRKNKTQPNTGDVIKLFGAPVVLNNENGLKFGSQEGSYAEYTGATDNYLSKTTATVADAIYQPFNKKSNITLSNGVYQFFPNTSITDSCTGSQEGIAFSTENADALLALGSAIDNGVYLSQYTRPITDQYDMDNITMVYTGKYIPKSEFGSTAVVFGGDTFTQKQFVKLRYWSSLNGSIAKSSFISYYGQSRINTQLGYNDFSQPKSMNLYGQKSVTGYLFPFSTQTEVTEEQFNFDAGFYGFNNVNRMRVYDPSISDNSKQSTTIYYSPTKAFSSVQDTYRSLKPFDSEDLDPKNGPGLGLLDVGDYMMVLQPRAVTLLPYNSDAFVSTTIGSVQTSSGDVYPNARRIVTTFGPSRKSHILPAFNRNGNSQPYWYSDKFSKLVRYGSDGIALLSDMHGFRTYLLSNFPKESREYDMFMGYHPRKQQVYTTYQGNATIGWNEVYNISSGRHTFLDSITRLFIFRDRMLAINGSDAYFVSEGSDYLNWVNSSGQLQIETVFNQRPDLDKRVLNSAFGIGESWSGTADYVLYSSENKAAQTNSDELKHRRGSLVSHAKRDNFAPIIGQWIKVKLACSEYIKVATAVINGNIKSRRP